MSDYFIAVRTMTFGLQKTKFKTAIDMISECNIDIYASSFTPGVAGRWLF